MSSSPTTSGPLTRARAKEAVDYVIGMVFEFTPVDTHPIGNALVVLTGKEDDLSIYKSWLELSKSQIDSLQYKGSNNKLFPLSQGYMTYVRLFKLMYLECQKDPTWMTQTFLHCPNFSGRYSRNDTSTDKSTLFQFQVHLEHIRTFLIWLLFLTNRSSGIPRISPWFQTSRTGTSSAREYK
jgi:hypothetical protein